MDFFVPISSEPIDFWHIMPDELHAELKAALAYDRSSFADFFNKAAEEYLSNRKTDKQKKSKSKNGGNRHE